MSAAPDTLLVPRLRSQTWPAGRHQLRRRKTRHEFRAHPPSKHLERLQRAKDKEEEYGLHLTPLFLGVAARLREHGALDEGLACHDGTYSIDFAVETLGGRDHSPSPSRDAGNGTDSGTERSGVKTPSFNPEDIAPFLAEDFVQKVREYQQQHFYKFVGAGITKRLATLSPVLPARLWSELDIVPMIFEQGLEYPQDRKEQQFTVDEEADSMARKSLMYFGPNMQPRLMVGYRNEVEVDVGGYAQLTWVGSYQNSVHERTWAAAMKYIESLKDRHVKMAFFNSTPQGGGVALMRHALVRFFRVVGVDCSWYVPKPKPEVFRITKTNHNILQGVADPGERLTQNHKQILQDWVYQNAKRFWLSEGGPLRPRSEGGADIVIVDDPQMPDLVLLSKEIDPSRPVIFRSHIQIRSDLADTEGTPTSEVWQWLWNKVQCADLFISHPVRQFVPSAVDVKKVGYMPATTDWMDGLNKELDEYNSGYYIQEFNTECYRQQMPRLAFPKRDYIVQIARFDPSKGLPHVLASYAELRRVHLKHLDPHQTPQLVIAGHGAVDDPDASLIYDQTLEALENRYADIRHDVVVVRLGPTDQILNALLSHAKVALQLSSREGFEVKVSEALHKGIPVVATEAGGIPLQVAHGKSGFLVQPGDAKAVAGHLHYLFTDQEAYAKMSKYAATHVSDEVSTVGNALAWVYLADTLTKGEKIEPNSRWINDMAREGAGLPYEEGEVHLPRDEKLDLTSPVSE